MIFLKIVTFLFAVTVILGCGSEDDAPILDSEEKGSIEDNFLISRLK